MRPHQLIPFASTFGALLATTGCVGYNTTMFMTKSNAGLDFDAKPPTAEINISRKEAVISPSFEGGQTPPVMASFKPNVGAGSGFANFFMGVGQTFAGGDAAMAMSMLYDKATATDKAPFDSAIHLSEPPKYHNFLLRVPGAGESRPLIFGTDTSLGLKAAWSGVGGAVPDTVKLGFNRKEFAWAPLSTTPSSPRQKASQVDLKLPPFLATIDSRQSIGTNNSIKVESLQYFATGDAATYLAMQKDVRAAMHARLDPNEKKFKAMFGSQAQNVLADTMFAVQTVLSRFAQNGDDTSADLLKQLDQMQGLAMSDKTGNADDPEFSFDAAQLLLTENENGERPVKTTCAGIQAYLSQLDRSRMALNAEATARLSGKQVDLQKPGAQRSKITDALQTEISAALAALTCKENDLKKSLAGNRVLIAAFAHVQAMLSAQ